MISMIRCLILCLCVTTLYAQQIPGSEIYLFDLKKENDRLVLSNAKNITNHPGYDNQPFFHPDKSLLYFASADQEGRTDIVEYDLKNGKTKKITNTPEREYSPTVTPDKKYLSCIIQRDNGAQDLGKYPINGGKAEVIIDYLKVGYHAWWNKHQVFLFVLGETNSLHLVDVRLKTDLVDAQNIGRSLHRTTEGSVSFIHKLSAEKWEIKIITKDPGPELTLGETLHGREDICWTPDMKVITSDGEKFFYASGEGIPVDAVAADGSRIQNHLEWKEIKLEGRPLKGITRIAVNGDGTKLAAVLSE
jgi:hypothetical protein